MTEATTRSGIIKSTITRARQSGTGNKAVVMLVFSPHLPEGADRMEMQRKFFDLPNSY